MLTQSDDHSPRTPIADKNRSYTLKNEFLVSISIFIIGFHLTFELTNAFIWICEQDDARWR